jgi:hypothetical protein
MLRRIVLLGSFSTAIAVAAACANDGYGVESCRTIEAERCRWVVQCNIGVGVRRDDDSSPVDDCIRYYDVACMHGMQFLTSSDPTDTQTQACASAIHNATSCDIVIAPETAPACAWLKPTADAGADASDAATEAATDASGQ